MPAARPPLLLLGSEPWRAAAEYVSHRVMSRPREAAGDGHPVIIFPGLASDGRVVAPLRRFCRALGYAAGDWGRGFNTGPGDDIDGWLQTLAEELRARVQAQGGRPPTLIGWSLGGLYARELAKLPGLAVRQVITIGTPFNGDVGQTHAGWLYRLLNRRAPMLAPAWHERLRRPPPVPTTSIYSRSDGVVAWQACRHARQSACVQDIEVSGSHLGMGWNPAVLRVVAACLAQPPGTRPRAGAALGTRLAV